MATTYTTIEGISAIAVGTAALWASTNPVVPKGIWAFESDTRKAKVGDGVALYNALTYTIDELFTAAQKALLAAAGAAGGVLVLDGNGLIPADKIPASFGSKPVFVANIAARDAISVADRNTIVIVLDASADATVTANMAYYVWESTGEVWTKLGEQESFDIDFTDFVKAGDALDRLADSATYVKMTVAERAKLATALTTSATYLFRGASPADFAA